jgi:hypothetical protein
MTKKKRGLRISFQYFIVFLKYKERYISNKQKNQTAILYHKLYKFVKKLPHLEFIYKLHTSDHYNIMLVFCQTLKEFKNTFDILEKKFNSENIKLYIASERWSYEDEL